MIYKIEKMSKWERQKAIYLMGVAEDLGLDVSRYGKLGVIDVNENSGNTYIWIEDAPCILYLPINCELTFNDIVCSVICPVCGKEEKTNLGTNTLKDLKRWARDPQTYTCECNAFK